MGQWKASIGSMGLGMIIGKKSDNNLLEFYRIGLVRKVWSHTRNFKKKTTRVFILTRTFTPMCISLISNCLGINESLSD